VLNGAAAEAEFRSATEAEAFFQRKTDERHDARKAAILRQHSDLLCCHFGRDAFSASALQPFVLEWDHGTVGRLAEAAQASKSREELLILADALAEAGCSSDLLMGHLRSHGTHSRFCWALDVILGRE
jgi:hypothetical protein